MIISKNGELDFDTASIGEIGTSYCSVNSGQFEVHFVCHESLHVSAINKMPKWLLDDFDIVSTTGSIALVQKS